MSPVPWRAVGAAAVSAALWMVGLAWAEPLPTPSVGPGRFAFDDGRTELIEVRPAGPAGGTRLEAEAEPTPLEPAEVRAIRDAIAAREAAVRREIEERLRSERLRSERLRSERLRSERQVALERAKALQDRFTRAGKLDEALAARRLVRELEAELLAVLPDPGSLGSYRGRNGESFTFRVTGSTIGSVWGTDVYTDDSSLATAAVHAGVLDDGETGAVEVTIVPGRPSFAGSHRNGVTSHDWGPFDGGFRVARPRDAHTAAPVADDPGNLTGDANRLGQTLAFRVTGTTTGYVWGTDVYTSDSTLAVAAVHAGLLKVGETGVVRVTILEGWPSYEGSTRHGVTSSGYGPWGGSYRFVRDGSAGPATPGRAGNKVEVEWRGNWYPAVILSVEGDRCRIRYDGYDETWDETVGPDRIRPRGEDDAAPSLENRGLATPRL